jgi:hypothetical protein
MTPELQQQLDLIAQAKQLAQHIDDDFTGHLSKIVTLKYGRLLLSSDEELYSKENQHKTKTLSLMSQDFARLRRCEIANRRALLEEQRFASNEEKTEQEVFNKFVEWNSHPDIRRLLVLAPSEHMRQMRKMYDIPPTKEDLVVEQELAALQKKQAAQKQPDDPEPPEDDNEGGSAPPPASENASQSNERDARSTASPSPGGEGRGEGELKNSGRESALESKVGRGTPCPPSSPTQAPSTAPAVQQTTTNSPISPVRPISPISEPKPQKVEPTPPKKSFLSKLRASLLGKTKEQTIAEIENQHTHTAQSKCKPNKSTPPTAPHASSPTPRASTQPTPQLSISDKAKLEGKSWTEALYLQSIPAPKKPAPPQTQPATCNFQPATYSPSLYGPAPAPIRPGDRWKVQTA